MLIPKLTNNFLCSNISSLLSNIDCQINKISNDLYNNTIFMLNKPVNNDIIIRLLNYKRILLAKYCNPLYCEKFSVEAIASKVKMLTLNCQCNCIYEDRTVTPSSSTTTTTTTINGSYIYSVRQYDCLTCAEYTLYTIFNNVQLTIGMYYTSSRGTIQILSYDGIDPEPPTDFIPPNSGKTNCAEIDCPLNYIGQVTGETPEDVCGSLPNLAVYSYEPNITVGTVLYTNPELTGIFVDTSNAYRTFSYYPYLTRYYIKLNTVGVITEMGIENCP